MNYTNLPPGRQRGLAYANNILNRYLNRMRRIPVFSPIRSSEYLTVRRYNPTFSIDFYVSVPNNNNEDSNTTYQTLSQLEDVKIGISLKKLIKNSIVKLSTSESGLCVICQDDIGVKEVIRNINKCNHNFHIDCIDRWLSENKKCPICKSELM